MKSLAKERPELANVRTSLAEVGNGTLDRIEKMVRFMSQERGFYLMKYFLGLRNLEVRRKAGIRKQRDDSLISHFRKGSIL